jgi:predicted polyphosphate/ATP-dependent NAD kinase
VPTVGIVVNPWAGKDVRRLHAPVGHTPDTAKVGIVRRVVLGALDAGADRVVVAGDLGRIGDRAVQGIDGAFVVDGPSTGSALDTRRAAAQFAELGCEVVVVLGGDGTCRDVAIGWPDVTMLAISTGTNNVFPCFVDGSSAGTAAGLVAAGRLPVADVSSRAKRLVVDVTQPDGSHERDIALVDVAAVDDQGTGARAVVRPDRIRGVVAAIATPTSTGLSSIAGRTHPLSHDEDGGVVVRLAAAGTEARRVHVPIVPGAFSVLDVASVERLDEGASARFDGPLVLAYDGERERVLMRGAVAHVSVDRGGPVVLDVDRALRAAARLQLFDAPDHEEAAHGD